MNSCENPMFQMFHKCTADCTFMYETAYVVCMQKKYE